MVGNLSGREKFEQVLVGHRMFQPLIDRLHVGRLPGGCPSNKEVGIIEAGNQLTSMENEVVCWSGRQAWSEGRWFGHQNPAAKSPFGLGAMSEG